MGEEEKRQIFEYFGEITPTNDKYIAKCLTCKKSIKGSKYITSNFITHLNTHKKQFQEYEERKLSYNRKRKSNLDSQSSLPVKKPELEQRKDFNQKKANIIITDFITELGLPINIVNHDATSKLVEGLSSLTSKVKCCSSFTVKGTKTFVYYK